jgi:hypothetical protein
MIHDSGMLRPQDLVLAFHLSGTPARTQAEMSKVLGLSQPEISNGLKRLQKSHLLLANSRKPVLPNLIEFCAHGVRYAFAAEEGRAKRGIPTAALAAPLKGKVGGADGALVWPAPSGTERATSLAPLHSCVIHAVTQDARLHRLLALLDGIRVGKSRLRQLSLELLTAELSGDEHEG